VVNATPRPLYPAPIVKEVEWAPGQVWTGAENLARTGTRSPNLLARSDKLYRLSYPGTLVLPRRYLNGTGEVKKKTTPSISATT